MADPIATIISLLTIILGIVAWLMATDIIPGGEGLMLNLFVLVAVLIGGAVVYHNFSPGR